MFIGQVYFVITSNEQHVQRPHKSEENIERQKLQTFNIARKAAE